MTPGLGVTLSHCSLTLGTRRVLRDVEIAVRPGDKWVILGPNGAGKTQLVKLLAGLRWPTPTGRERRTWQDGRGRAVDPLDARALIAYVGAESQDKYARYGWNHTLEEVVTTGLFGTDIPLDQPDAAQRRVVRRLLGRFGLAELAQRRMLEVSYGERRLALVARALAAQPAMLLLDEAFNGLDGPHRVALDRALAQLLRSRTTLVLTAHRIEDVPRGITHLALVSAGRVTVRHRPARRALHAWLQAHPGPRGKAVVPRGRARTAMPYIRLEGVDVHRDGEQALRRLDWSLYDGEHWAVLGRNGSGKSTLLGALYGQYPVALGGRLLRRDYPPGTPLDELRERMALVTPELQAEYDATSTLEEIVVSGLRSSVGLDTPATTGELRRARRALDALGLRALALRRPREVSYGEMRLALFARAFVREPDLLLLDEPFTGLDPSRRTRLRAALDALAANGVRLVLAVHHRDDLPSAVNRVLRLDRGRIIAAGARRSVVRPAAAGRHLQGTGIRTTVAHR
jgi:molybdate transport system ATP-binding protein